VLLLTIFLFDTVHHLLIFPLSFPCTEPLFPFSVWLVVEAFPRHGKLILFSVLLVAGAPCWIVSSWCVGLLCQVMGDTIFVT
jgi:hypothetical protein